MELRTNEKIERTIVPAYLFKNDIENEFAKLAYTEKLMWFDGCIENFHHEVTEEDCKYQFAICEDGKLVGFISFRVDWYCSMAFNFGLISFSDSKVATFKAIREVIKMVKSFNLHRIDFRCVGGNPAEKRYNKIIKRFESEYSIRSVRFLDNIKDRQGKYHDTIMYELIKRD